MSDNKQVKKTVAQKNEKTATKFSKPKKPLTKTKKAVKLPIKTKEKRKKTQQEKIILKLKEKLKQKNHPTFRGRFGGRFKRRKSNKKWDKWMKPRGIDIVRKNDDGALAKIGYRVPKKIRYLHPSGLPQVSVSNLQELNLLKEKNVAVRLSGKIGKKKRIEMLKVAKEQNIKLLNRWKK